MNTPPTPKIVLAVDDDPKITNIISAFLAKTGRYRVECEDRASHAVEKVRALRPSVVLLDWNMPGQNGLEIAQAIRREPEVCETPLLFVTGSLSKTEADHLMRQTPGLQILLKPFNRDQLVGEVDRATSEEEDGGGWGSKPGPLRNLQALQSHLLPPRPVRGPLTRIAVDHLSAMATGVARKIATAVLQAAGVFPALS